MVEETEFTSLEQELAGDITADRVVMNLSGAESINAREVRMDRSGVGSIEAEDVSLHQSVAQSVQARRMELSQAGAMTAIGEDISLTQSCAGLVSGKNIKGDIRAGLVIGDSVEGSVTTILDQRSALTLGAVLGASLFFVYALRRLLGR